jgi:hypothetical protein
MGIADRAVAGDIELQLRELASEIIQSITDDYIGSSGLSEQPMSPRAPSPSTPSLDQGLDQVELAQDIQLPSEGFFLDTYSPAQMSLDTFGLGEGSHRMAHQDEHNSDGCTLVNDVDDDFFVGVSYFDDDKIDDLFTELVKGPEDSTSLSVHLGPVQEQEKLGSNTLWSLNWDFSRPELRL